MSYPSIKNSFTIISYRKSKLDTYINEKYTPHQPYFFQMIGKIYIISKDDISNQHCLEKNHSLFKMQSIIFFEKNTNTIETIFETYIKFNT